MLNKKVFVDNDWDAEDTAKEIASLLVSYSGLNKLFNFDLRSLDQFKFMEKGIKFYIQGDVELYIYQHNERELNQIKFSCITNSNSSNSYVAKFKMYAPENIENKAAELIKEL